MNHHTELLPDPLPPEPLVTVNRWMAEGWQRRLQPNPNAMVLATSDPEGRPSARVVLCKEIVPQPGYLVFYTNYLSRKGRQLARNPRAAAVIHWDALHRQVRVEGPILEAPAADSDAYFASRPWQSRIGAWASEQSAPVASRALLQEAVASTAKRFGTPDFGRDEGKSADSDMSAGASAGASASIGAGSGAGGPSGAVIGARAGSGSTTGASANARVSHGASAGADAGATASDFVIPRPPHWGGYQLWADSVELWVEGEGRIHDRARWTRELTPRPDGSFSVGPWAVTRLQP